MLKNYIKVAWRSLLRNRLSTFINITGLAIGLATFLMINEYVSFEKSYDTQFDASERIYRLSTNEVVNGQVDAKDAMAFHPAYRALAAEIPEIERHTTSLQFDDLVFRIGSSVYTEKEVISGDSSFLDVFTYKVHKGSKDDMLSKPYSIVLSESKARYFFGDEDPIGQSIEILGEFDEAFMVTGIIEDPTPNTHYKFDILISDASLADRFDYNDWCCNNYYGYGVLSAGTTPAEIDDLVQGVVKKQFDDDTNVVFDLNPITDIHLKSDYTFEPEIPGNERAVSFLILIAYFILFIAWVNYINLTTAKAVERAKEVGLRKVIGAFKHQLVVQFLFEAVLVNLLAIVLALVIAELILPSFNQLVGVNIWSHVSDSPTAIRNIGLFFVIGTLAAGFYPAFVLSSFKPAVVLKGKFYSSNSGVLLRQALVVFQFAASMVLIGGTLIVNKQIDYMQTQNIGIDIDHVLGFQVPLNNDEEVSKVDAFKQEIGSFSSIMSVGATSNLPGGNGSDINSTTGQLRIYGITEPLQGVTYVQFIDDHFLDAVTSNIIVGRNFDRAIASDSSAIIVNEAFLARFNLANPLEMVNEELAWGTQEDGDRYKIIGIIEDFNRMSLKEAVEPTLYIGSMHPDYLVVALDPKNYQDALRFVESKWVEFFPDYPLEYTFLDQRFEALYQDDKRFGQVFIIFSVLAMFIALLGLYGLASFLSIQRTKEIGIRKVLGASIPSIIIIFYKDFIWLLLLSAVLGIPIIYLSLNGWLENYAFRVSFPWVIPFISLLLVAGFALLTIGFQTYKVAVLNPADTLKHE